MSNNLIYRGASDVVVLTPGCNGAGRVACREHLLRRADDIELTIDWRGEHLHARPGSTSCKIGCPRIDDVRNAFDFFTATTRRRHLHYPICNCASIT